MANKTPNFIEQLNNIKIEDLQKYIDIEKIKNINADQVKEFVLSQPDLVVKILFITITFFTVMSSFSSYNKKTVQLKQDIIKMETLLKAVETFDATKKESDDLAKSFPQGIPTDQVLDKISDIANKHNIKISSFSPAQEKAFDLWQLTTTNIVASSEDYNSMLKFIQEIEDPKYAFRVDAWSGLLTQESKQTDKKSLTTSKGINANITIGAVKLKNE